MSGERKKNEKGERGEKKRRAMNAIILRGKAFVDAF